MYLYEEHTDALYVCVTRPYKRKEFIAEAFVKDTGFLWYAVLSYPRIPSRESVVRDTYGTCCRSPRPYRPGQACDGSITACVYHLFVQLCDFLGLDPLELYHEAYNDDIMTRDQLDAIRTFAEWQGVEVIAAWDREVMEHVLESLHAVNFHQLANILEERLPS